MLKIVKFYNGVETIKYMKWFGEKVGLNNLFSLSTKNDMVYGTNSMKAYLRRCWRSFKNTTMVLGHSNAVSVDNPSIHDYIVCSEIITLFGDKYNKKKDKTPWETTMA